MQPSNSHFFLFFFSFAFVYSQIFNHTLESSLCHNRSDKENNQTNCVLRNNKYRTVKVGFLKHFFFSSFAFIFISEDLIYMFFVVAFRAIDVECVHFSSDACDVCKWFLYSFQVNSKMSFNILCQSHSSFVLFSTNESSAQNITNERKLKHSMGVCYRSATKQTNLLLLWNDDEMCLTHLFLFAAKIWFWYNCFSHEVQLKKYDNSSNCEWSFLSV